MQNPDEEEDEPMQRLSPSKGAAGLEQGPAESAGFEANTRFPDIDDLDNQAAQVDGKEFFKRARHRLSFQQFNDFLANIKKLNAHTQSRDQTLDIARGIFGAENGDLHEDFTALLSRHGV